QRSTEWASLTLQARTFQDRHDGAREVGCVDRAARLRYTKSFPQFPNQIGYILPSPGVRHMMMDNLRQWLSVRPRPHQRRVRPRLEVLEDRLAPAVFNVNSTADILNPPGSTVTLRSAIQQANALPGGNTINLTVAGAYKITLGGANENNNATG